VTFFEPDLRKAGGAYRTVTGRVKKIDEYQKAIIFEDETSVFFHQIQNIDNSDF
jgi:hypothetical protein